MLRHTTTEGMSTVEKGDYDRAIEDFDEAIRLNFENATTYHNRGVIYGRKGEYNRAIADFNEAIRLRTNHAAIYLNRGTIYEILGNYDHAIEDYDNAVRLCPNYEIDFVDRNFAYGGKDIVENVRELLNNVISSPRNSAADFYYTGVRALFKNDRITARRCFNKALELGYGDRDKIERHLENLKKRR